MRGESLAECIADCCCIGVVLVEEVHRVSSVFKNQDVSQERLEYRRDVLMIGKLTATNILALRTSSLRPPSFSTASIHLAIAASDC